MTREVVIYAPEKGPISMRLILDELGARGLSSEWKSTFLSERGDLDNWSAGYIVPNGESAATVSAFTEDFEDYLREEIIESYENDLTNAQRQALGEATVSYRIKTDNGSSRCETVVANVVEIIAANTKGLILDLVADQLLSIAEYRALYLPGER